MSGFSVAPVGRAKEKPLTGGVYVVGMEVVGMGYFRLSVVPARRSLPARGMHSSQLEPMHLNW